MAKAYKKIQIVGVSETSVTEAVENAVRKAAETVRNLDWFEVDEVRGRVEDGEVTEYQVSLKIGFRLD